MSSADWMLAVTWVGLTLYALFGGADFGAGFWDLLAGGDVRGRPQRGLIEHSIGPVWEANHVWLIFVIVLAWTGFPPVFAAVASTLYIPLTLAAFGIIARGAAFAFRKASTELWQQRLFGAAFALSSVLTPFFLGTIAGGIASGRVPSGLARGNLLTSWWNPTSILGGVLAVGTCAYLAAVYLCADARRDRRAARGRATVVPGPDAPRAAARDRVGGGRDRLARAAGLPPLHLGSDHRRRRGDGGAVGLGGRPVPATAATCGHCRERRRRPRRVKCDSGCARNWRPAADPFPALPVCSVSA
jgi:hypothetical protein